MDDGETDTVILAADISLQTTDNRQHCVNAAITLGMMRYNIQCIGLLALHPVTKVHKSRNYSGNAD